MDNVEDIDAVVGWLAESTRPHGFAISETQFVAFILNASRRLFSDRFFTSSFRPEFYSYLGHNWVNDNGPCDDDDQNAKDDDRNAKSRAERRYDRDRCETQQMVESNGHSEPVSPLKRILVRTIPELEAELEGASLY